VLHAFAQPNDPLFAQQQAYLSTLRVPQAWDVAQGDTAVKIAIVDTGVDLDHPDLASRIVAGYDFINNDSVAQDDEGHGTMVGSNVGATKESGEPNRAGNAGGKSIWFTWTAPASATVSIDTIGSAFDTVLGVYTGTSVSALTVKASDDDSGGNLTSKVSLAVVAGTTYRVAVDGYSGASGAVKLTFG
jgi:subtilisin family serine protease